MYKVGGFRNLRGQKVNKRSWRVEVEEELNNWQFKLNEKEEPAKEEKLTEEEELKEE